MEIDLSAYFDPIDYAIFGGMLAISAIIGIYFAFFAKQKQDNTQEYLMGSKSIGVFPISMSLIASNISGIAMMGLPSEVYSFGTQLWIVVLSEVTAYTFGTYTFLPVLYNLDITSSYEYLERRFDSSIRKLGSLLFLIGNMLYVPIVIYVPALAFSQISGMSLSVLIPLVCVVCTFYTTLGGMKAVVWTDTFQTMMIFLGVLAVAVIGTINVGGVEEVWKRGENSGRIEFFNMNWDVTIRHTFWSVFIGKFMGNLSICSVNQAMVQRYLAMPTLNKARLSIYILSLGTFTLMSFCCYTGLVIFAAFHDCDPVTVGYVRKSDGIVPYFVMKYVRHIPALPGLFMAGVFSAALSSMSTCMNSMCGIIFEDFIKPHLKKPISEKRASFYMKIMVVVIGFITMIMSSMVDKLGAGVVQTTSSLSGITLGTLLGVYILGMFIPWANTIGTMVGGITGSIIVGWISFGAQYAISQQQIVYPKKDFSVEGCDNSTMAVYFNKLNATMALPPTPAPDEPFPLFRLTYIYFTPLGVLISVVVGVVVSWVTGFQDPAELDLNLLCPLVRPFFKKKNKFRKNVVRTDNGETKKMIVR